MPKASGNTGNTENQGNTGDVENQANQQNQAATEAVATETQETAVAIVNPFSGFDFSDLGFSEDELKNLTGLEDVGAGDIRIPYANLMSKDSKDYKKGDIVFPDGKVVHGANGEVAEGISILKIGNVRVMFPTPFNPNNDFICRSIDGVVGHTDGEYAGRKCVECEFSKYPDAGGASPCRDQRLLLCSLPDGGMFHLQVGGVGVGVFKTFLSAQLLQWLSKGKNILGIFKLTAAVKTVDTSFGPFPAIDFKLNPKDPFVPQERLKNNLTSLKAYKEFERQHLESAASQTKAAMAVGQEEAMASEGPNGKLF